MEEFADSAELVHNRGGLVSIVEELLSFDSNKSETISEKFTNAGFLFGPFHAFPIGHLEK